MFNKTNLTEKLTADLREIAKTAGIKNAQELRKNELIEQILLIQQADNINQKTENMTGITITEKTDSMTEKKPRKKNQNHQK